MTTEQMLGLGTGVAFGFLLQQGRVLRFEKQVGALLFRDMTIFKFMLSAIIVGMVGINVLASMGVVPLSIKSTAVGANLIGGLIFGVGWAIVGYCPGTSLGAVGEGRWHAIFAIVGMLIGAAIYAEVYPSLKESVLTWGQHGKLTLPEYLGISRWLVIAGLSAAFVLLFWVFERLKI
jgi:uncharacterized membrane protein YedE/YeeE